MKIEDNFVYNYEYDEIKNNNFKEDDLGIVLASVDHVENKLLIDSGSNLNLISVDCFNSLPGQYETVGICHGCICEALGDDTVTDAIVIRLNVLINNYSFYANFCVINHNTNYFDLLIGLKTIANITSYILQYNQGNSSMYEKHNFNDLCQLKGQINQLKNNTIKYIDNILDNKSEEYNNNTYKIYSINTINYNNINNVKY